MKQAVNSRTLDVLNEVVSPIPHTYHLPIIDYLHLLILSTSQQAL